MNQVGVVPRSAQPSTSRPTDVNDCTHNARYLNIHRVQLLVLKFPKPVGNPTLQITLFDGPKSFTLGRPRIAPTPSS